MYKYDREVSCISGIIRPDWPNGGSSTPPASPTLLNPGSDFYATIYYPNGGKLLEARDSGDSGYPVNVQLNNQSYASVNSSDPRCIWHFVRHGDDGTYKIVNEYYGYCLDVETGVAGPEQNIGAWHEDHGGPAERWYIAQAAGNDRWYSLISALEYPSYVMDVYGGYTAPGTNVQLWTTDWKTENAAQQFNIIRQDSYQRPSAPSVPRRLWAYTPEGETTITWDSVAAQNSYDSRAYDVRIKNASTGAVVVSTRVTGTSYTYEGNLPAGEWIAEVRAVNTKYASTSNNYASSYASYKFTIRSYEKCNLTLTASPAEGGTVSGGGQYTYNDYVMIRADASEGYRFVRWEWDDGSRDNHAYTGIFVTEDTNITAVFEKDNPYIPDVPDKPETPEGGVIRIKNSGIKADGVFNNKGYGSVYLSGKGTEMEEDFEYAPRAALVDRNGSFVLSYRDSYGRFYVSDHIVSLTEGSPYGISDDYSVRYYSPKFYNMDGSQAFVLEGGDYEINENKSEHIDYYCGPMQDGYAAMIKQVDVWETWGIAGGGHTDRYVSIIDEAGNITCTLPEEYSQILQAGSLGITPKRSLGWCGEGLFAFYKNTDHEDWSVTTEVLGYMDPTGRTVIDLAGRGFTNSAPFSEGLAAVWDEDGKLGFIDRTGTLVIPCIYEGRSGNFTDGLCGVQKDSKWGYIDASGDVVIPCIYDDVYGAGDGLAAVVKDGRCGLVDYENQVVVPLEYDDISSYENGVAYAVRNGVLYLITDYNPEAPDTPDTPDVPDTPDTPDTPDVPDTPDTPETPVYPVYPSYPGSSTRPDTTPSTTKPSGTAPDKTEEPAQPETPTEPVQPAPEWVSPYTDVPADQWYYDAVKFVSVNGLMNGTGGSLFEPDAGLSRAMLAQILYNREGRPAVTGGSVFTDTLPGAWYADAVAWAAEKGLVNGYGDGTFGPDGGITREQLAAVLWRYAGSPAPAGGGLSFSDADKASGYALDALRWAVERGVLSGTGNGLLDPAGPATRAQAAQMLKNYLEQ